jgi:hypothetical protein
MFSCIVFYTIYLLLKLHRKESQTPEKAPISNNIAVSSTAIPKKFKISIVIFLFLAFLVLLNWEPLLLQKIPIQYVGELDATKNLPFIKYPYNSEYTWFINWLADGLSLPHCDFSKNYLILSQYKIDRLYFHPNHIDECCGAPPGFADLNRLASKSHKVYIYKMPKILLTQGIG